MEIKNVVFREDLYPRFEPDQKLIQKYSESIDVLPKIIINQNNILIDGLHRLRAHQIAKCTEIEVIVLETVSEKELKKMAYQLNSNHGKQISNAEKKKYANEMIEELSIKELSDILFVSERTIGGWTDRTRRTLKEDRNRKILEMHLRAWHTQQDIAVAVGVPQQTVSRIIDNFTQNGKIAEMGKDFQPYLYTIWTQLKGNDTEHFGSFPAIYMQNLLYYHTKPFDIVFDPFAGDGTTVDICKEMSRRYYCSDRIVKPGREKDILERDITEGLPEITPDFVFLDPPYWKQAKGKYSDSNKDLGNMTLEAFNQSINELLTQLSQKKIKTIAAVIQPTQYSNDFELVDHVFDFHKMLSDKYKIIARYILPYSTQQYNAQMVDIAKEKKECLVLHRDLVVWEVINDQTKE